jgi:Secretion system C-terminal sorting domain
LIFAKLLTTEGSILIETEDKIELITITNTMGQLIRGHSKNKAFNFNDLPLGVYIISVKTDSDYVCQKVFRE